MRARLVIALIGLAWLAGCASASPAASTQPSDGEPAAAAECPVVSLRSPGGANVDLTGRWRSSDGGTYYLRQVSSCVWFVGLSADTGSPGGVGTAGWTNAFFGSIASDFTFRGSWADLPWGRDNGVGEITFHVRFDEVDGVEGVTLQLTEATGGFGGEFLMRPEDEVDLQVRLQESEECLTFVADTGVVYEVVTLPPGWSPGAPLRLVGPDQEQILPLEEFELSGDIARGEGWCSTGLMLFVDSIEVGSPT